MDELQNLMNDILDWSSKTFKDENALSKLRHLEKEVNELCDTMISSAVDSPKNIQMRHEFADCFMLLLGSAKLANFTAEDLIKATYEKLEINKQRTWGKPDKNGIVEHIRDNETKISNTTNGYSYEFKKELMSNDEFDRFWRKYGKVKITEELLHDPSFDDDINLFFSLNNSLDRTF